MKDIKKLNLRECTSQLGGHIADIPVVLIKCFYELQKFERIKRPDLYKETDHEQKKNENNVAKLSKKRAVV